MKDNYQLTAFERPEAYGNSFFDLSVFDTSARSTDNGILSTCGCTQTVNYDVGGHITKWAKVRRLNCGNYISHL